MGYTLPDGTQPYPPPPPPPLFYSLLSTTSLKYRCFLLLFCNTTKIKTVVKLKAKSNSFLDGEIFAGTNSKSFIIPGMKSKSMFLWFQDTKSNKKKPEDFIELSDNNKKDQVFMAYVEFVSNK